MVQWRGELRWTIKSSFIEYVRRSGGEVQVSGGAFLEEDEFAYPRDPDDTAAFTGTTPHGSAQFTGAVRLTGHGGMLDVTFLDPVLDFDSGSVTLRVHDEDGDPIDFASCELGTPLVREDVAEWLGVKVVLSPEGADVFNGMYRPYSELDSLNFTLSMR